MAKRKRVFRTGLLIALLVFLPGNVLFSQEDEGADQSKTTLEIRIETSPANPEVSSSWSVYILVNHPIPSEVNVTPPQFPSFLALERVRTEGRLIKNDSESEGERWTRVEFLFTPLRAGAVTLGPFKVSIPGQQAETGTVSISFPEGAGTVRRYEPRLRWIGQIPSVPSGEQGELFLELSNWEPQKNAPEGIFRGRAPRNAIIEDKAPRAEGEGLYRYSVIVIPLEESGVVLEPFSFHADIYTLNVPGITVPVQQRGTSILQTRASAVLHEETIQVLADIIPGDEISARPFPQGGEEVFFLFRGEYGRIVAGARTLWEEGRRAEALAEIRRNERDRFSGPFLVSLRREMEQSLGLGFTGDERWHPLKLPLLAWVLMGILVLSSGIVLLVFRPRPGVWRNKVPAKNVTSRRRGGFRNGIILIFSIGLALIFLEEGLGNIYISRLNTGGMTAVLERSVAYRVPDEKGAVNARFGEGQPVIVGSYRPDWCFVESPDGRSGWVKRADVISY